MHRRLPAVAALLGLTLGLGFGPGRVRGEDAAGPQPDFEFFVARIAPILEARCASCHADRRKRGRGHALRPPPGRKARTADHRANYETVLERIEAGNPAGSVWLRCAVGREQGGLAHAGGPVIRIDSLEFRTMVDFINGQTLAPPPEEVPAAPARVPEVGSEGIRLDAGAGDVEGALVRRDDAEAWGGVVIRPEGRGAVTWSVRTTRDATWRLEVRARGRDTSLGLAIAPAPAARVAVDSEALAEVGHLVPVANDRPLDPRRGALAVEGRVLTMRGEARAPAAFLVPIDVEHDRLEAQVRVPGDADGGDDVLLLAAATSLDEALFVGLLDAGRILAVGRLVEGSARVLETERLGFAATDAHVSLGIAWDGGEVRGMLDGSERVRAPLETPPALGHFGVLTHGRADVLRLAAHAAWRVYDGTFAEAPVVRLPAGTHRIRVTLDAGGPEIDGVSLMPYARAEDESRVGDGGADAAAPAASDDAPLPPREPPPPPLTAASRRRFDRDGDGRVSPDEFPGSDALFKALDRNGDGYLDDADDDEGEAR